MDVQESPRYGDPVYGFPGLFGSGIEPNLTPAEVCGRLILFWALWSWTFMRTSAFPPSVLAVVAAFPLQSLVSRSRRRSLQLQNGTPILCHDSVASVLDEAVWSLAQSTESELIFLPQVHMLISEKRAYSRARSQRSFHASMTRD